MFARLVGTLFIRTVDRAERIYYAMLARGFQGDIPTLKKSRMTATDFAFLVTTIALIFVFRFFSFTEEIGRTVQGLFI